MGRYWDRPVPYVRYETVGGGGPVGREGEQRLFIFWSGWSPQEAIWGQPKRENYEL